MRTRRFRLNVATITTATATAAAIAVSGTTVAVAQPANADTAQLTISNITDFHGYWNTTQRVPGATHLKCAVDRAAEGRNHIFTSSGDLIGASPFESMLLDDAPTIDVLNLMGLEVSAVGNHEFDQGAEDFSNRVVNEANWSWVAANADSIDGTEDYVIKDIDGVKVAFVGTITDDMPNLVNPAAIAGITWNNPVAVTNSVADELKNSKKADIVVALVHEGGIKASEFSDSVDVAFLGHSHQVINEPDNSPVLIQAGEYGKNLANVDISFDRATGEVTFDKVELLDADQIRACDTPQPEVEAIVKEAVDAASAEGNRVIGKVDTQFYRNGAQESQLNNFIAEVTRQGVTNNSAVKVDIGVMNAGGVRAELEPGEVTYAEAFAIQPFGNENTYIELKGSDFLAALEQQWREDPDRPMFPLGVSDNVTYTYDPTAPVGSKVTSVTIDGKPLDPEATYIVAGSQFLLNGGDKFEAFTRGSAQANLGYIDVNALVEYLGANENPTPRTSQSNIGVHLPKSLKAGEKATIELSSLLYADGESASTVTVTLGDATASAPITAETGGATQNEYGVAAVELDVPAGLTGTQELKITTDAGTEAVVPVELGAATTAPGTDDSKGDDSKDGDSKDGDKKDPSHTLQPVKENPVLTIARIALVGLASILGLISRFIPAFLRGGILA